MSRADRRLPAAPRIGAALRVAGVDLYYNSWRLVVGNLVFGIVLLALLVALTTIGNLGWLLVLALVPPAAGVQRLATNLFREGHVVMSDFTAELLRPWRALGVGALQLLVALVLVVDAYLGSQMQNLLGAFLAVSALYAAVIWWMLAVVLWPLLLDPLRAGDPIRRQLRLAVMLLVAHPFRIAALGLVLGLIVVISVVFVAAILTISLAYVCLVAAHYVLPAADRLEGRPTVVIED